MKFLSTITIILGVILCAFSIYLLTLRFSPRILAFDSNPRSVIALNYSSPTKISIPTLGINLPIITQVLNSNKWETTSKGVSYLASSPVPGEIGNSVLYGHNWKSILANLTDINTGESILIEFSDGSKREFTVEYTAVVDPSETYIIDNTHDTRITIYTCTGFLDSKRFVVVAKPTT